jgi:hypothetical protein
MNSFDSRPSGYPVTFSVDYPERQLNRLTTLFRIFTVVPIAVLAGLLPGSELSGYAAGAAFSAGSFIFVPIVLMLLFRKKYPGWWFDWNLELSRFVSRIGVYLALMDDRYPSTDEQQSVHLHYPDPASQELERDCRWSSGYSPFPITSSSSSSESAPSSP